MDPEKLLAGGVSVININGLKIRQIREEKGLTQLYVSTVVGVTTDTISRWENRRYPTIKKENAIRLAEALEVPLEAIIDTGEGTEAGEELPPQAEAAPAEPSPAEEEQAAPPQSASGPRSVRRRPVGVLLAALFMATILLTAYGWWKASRKVEKQVVAFRSMPAHTPPAGFFPVLIEVTASGPTPFSLILKEKLPQNCVAVRAMPGFVDQEGASSELKWIGKMNGDYALFSYLARVDPGAPMDSRLNFSGGITLRSGDKNVTPVSGASSVLIRPYHWADSNSDGRIDDEEILSAHDTYGGLDGAVFDQKQLEDIWSGKGYSWNPAKRTFEILP